MSENLKRTFNQTRLSNLVCFAFLIAAGVAVAPTVAQIHTGEGCPPCSGLVTLAENFDSVTPPTLPMEWLATNALGPPPLWVTSNNGVPTPPADTPPNAVFIDDPAVLSDKRLDSFQFPLAVLVQLTFRQNFNVEASDIDPNLGFDGGVLEISFDGGNTFQDILAAGGSFLSGGYNRTIATDRGSPIAGRQAWSGNSPGFITTVVNLPFIPTGGRLRWRMATDNSGSGDGWRVDTVSFSWCEPRPGCSPSPPPSPRPPPTPAPRPPVPSARPSPQGTPAFTPAPRPSP